MKPKLRRIALPIALVSAGTFALIGCIPLPGSFRLDEGGPGTEERIGRASSKKPIRLGLAAAAAVWVLVGCLPVPGTYRPSGGQPGYEELVGPSGSDRVLRIGEATPDDVIAVLGEWPPGRSVQTAGDSYLLARTGDAMLYTHSITTQRMVLPLRGRVEESHVGPRYLALKFGAGRKLLWFSVHKSEGEARRVLGLAEPTPDPS